MNYDKAKRVLFRTVTPAEGTIFEKEHLIMEVEAVIGAKVFYNVLSFGKVRRRDQVGPRTRHISMSLREYWRGLQSGEIKVM